MAGFQCEQCGLKCMDKRPKRAMRMFDLHHVSYARLGKERLTDVRVLCRSCHFDPNSHPWKATNS